MIYPIVAYGDPVLRKLGEDIDFGNPELPTLIADMYDTMYNAHGIGLAAPQIGKAIRLFIVDGRAIEEEGLEDFKKVFINATIVEEFGEEWEYEEGCLSIPNVRENVSRPSNLILHYFDEKGNEFEEEFSGMKARIIQHEYDHIDGVLFTDHLSGFKKRLLKAKLEKISKGKMPIHYRMRFPFAK